jgi:hypothetical protein
MKIFWQICRWAAISWSGVAVVFVVTQGIGFLDYKYKLGLLDNCSFVVVAFSCRGGASAWVLEFLLNVPFLVVFYAPLLLFGITLNFLNTGTIDNQLGIWITLVIATAMVWFVLAMAGIIRGVTDIARWLRS